MPVNGVGLRVARVVVLTLVAATLLAVLTSLVLAPAYIPRHQSDAEFSSAWTPAQIQAALAQLTWPPSTVAWFEFGRGLFLYLGTLLPGLLILRRRSHDWLGLYVAFAFTMVPALVVLGPLTAWVPGLQAVIHFAGVTSWQFYFILFYVFPNGRFVPSWTGWLLPVWVAMNLIPGAFNGTGVFASLPGLVLIPYALVFIAVGSQIYRYFRRSDATERLQTKWVVLALALTMVTIGWLGGAFQRPQPGSQALGTTLLLEMGRLAVVNVGFTIVPIAIVIAILRYRLWEIDLIIRRTLIYTVLSAVLALAYFGSILILQNVFQAVTGNSGGALVTVISTLAIAALFGPVRARVQRVVDRRFYRQKYDAARTLAAFGAQARDVVALDQLSEQLVAAVDETMQPASVGLWLRKAGGR